MGRSEDMDFVGEEATECQDSYQRYLTAVASQSGRS